MVSSYHFRRIKLSNPPKAEYLAKATNQLVVFQSAGVPSTKPQILTLKRQARRTGVPFIVWEEPCFAGIWGVTWEEEIQGRTAAWLRMWGVSSDTGGSCRRAHCYVWRVYEDHWADVTSSGGHSNNTFSMRPSPTTLAKTATPHLRHAHCLFPFSTVFFSIAFTIF